MLRALSRAPTMGPMSSPLGKPTSSLHHGRHLLVAGYAIFVVLISCGIVRAQGYGPRAVEVMSVVEREVAPTIQLVGTVRPQCSVTVASEIAGVVERLPADEGMFVKKGTSLCSLRDAPLRFALAESESSVNELEAALGAAGSDLSKAQFEHDRTERLFKLDRSSEKERSDTIADLESAKARQRQAEWALAAAKAVASLRADRLARASIAAPFDGYIVAKLTERGAWVDSGGDVVELVDLSTVRVRVNVPEAFVNFCRVGELAMVEVESQTKGYVRSISRVIPRADERARTFPIDIDVENPDALLKAGMFVRASVPSGARGRQLLAHKNAVVMRGPSPTVFVVRSTEKGQTAEEIKVKVEFEVHDHVALSAANLAAGDVVVVRGNEFLRAATPIIARPSQDTPLSRLSTTTQRAIVERSPAGDRNSELRED